MTKTKIMGILNVTPEYVESNERFADFEIREGERKERVAYEAKQAELERIKREQEQAHGQTEGGTN